MVHAETLMGSLHLSGSTLGPTSGLTSRASASSIPYTDSEASRLPTQMGARGRRASCARNGRGGRMRGGALQKQSWSNEAILLLVCDMKGIRLIRMDKYLPRYLSGYYS